MLAEVTGFDNREGDKGAPHLNLLPGGEEVGPPRRHPSDAPAARALSQSPQEGKRPEGTGDHKSRPYRGGERSAALTESPSPSPKMPKGLRERGLS